MIKDGGSLQKFGADNSNTLQTPWGEFAWRADDISKAISDIRLSNSVILGGDVITPKFEYTGDNWFYQPAWLPSAEYDMSLQSNIDRSIKCTMEYINKYISKNSKDYLFIFVVCTATEAYLHARRRAK